MVEGRVIGVSPRGEGVVDHAEREVRVGGAFLGERVSAVIVGRSRHRALAHAGVREILEPSPARRSSPCPHHGFGERRCGGCPWIELGEEAQLDQARAMLAALDLEVDEVVASPEAFGYRRASKRVAFTRGGALHLGSWSPRTHVGAPMRGCPVDHPRIAAAFDELEDVARRLGVEAFDEASGEGELRYAWAKTDGAQLVLTLITASGDPRPLAEALAVPDAVAHSRQAARGNAIRGEAPEWLRGEAALDPLGFAQPNPGLIDLALDALLADQGGAALGGARAWDLYAGSGAITRRLRERFDEVTPCERYAPSAEALGVAPREVESWLSEREAAPELVVANPPRRGMGAGVCAELLRLAPARLHVMSCGPEGLARDRAALTAGGYQVRALAAYQSLPQTPHVELVLKLVRAQPKE